MLIRGGENVYPREVEEYLLRHPQGAGRAGVRRARSRSTARRCAPGSCSRPATSATEDEIRDFCHGQIAHYKVPRYVRFVAEFPMTVTGKAQKFVMREPMMAELGA